MADEKKIKLTWVGGNWQYKNMAQGDVEVDAATAKELVATKLWVESKTVSEAAAPQTQEK